MTITKIGNSQALAGRWLTLQFTQSGGTAYGTNPITLTSGGTNAFIVPGTQVVTNSSNTCILTVDLGTSAGTIVFTDANGATASLVVASAYVAPTYSGTAYFVTGGVAQPSIPQVAIAGTAGTTTVYYQIVAHNTAGATQGFNVVTQTGYNPSGTIAAGSGIAVVTNSNATLSGTNYNTIAWGPLTDPGGGTVTYDVLRSSDGTTWTSLALAQTATYYADQGGSTSAYTLPTANTTAVGNNSSDGLTLGTAWATAAKAASVATSGCTINFKGWVTDSAQVVFPDGIKLVGTGKLSTTLYSTFPSTSNANVNYRLPSNGYVSDITFSGPPVTGTLARILGNGNNDSPTVATDVWRVRVLGSQSSMFFSTQSGTSTNFAIASQVDFYDCDFFGTHGSAGGAQPFGTWSTNQTLNFTRCSFRSITNGMYTTSTSQSMNVYGNVCARDCNFTASADSGLIPQVQIVSLRCNPTYPSNVKLIGCRLNSAGQDIAANSNSQIWLDNTPLDPTKKIACGLPQGAVTDTPATPTVTNANTLRGDPLFVPDASKVIAGTAFGPDANGASVGTAPIATVSKDPGSSNVSVGVAYQISGANLVGSLVIATSRDPGVSNVRAGVNYQISGAAFIGTLGQATGTQPAHSYQIAAQQVTSVAPTNLGMIIPGSSVALTARICDESGNEVTPLASSIASIVATITDMMADTVGSPIAIDVTASTTAGTWSIDNAGYNLSIKLFGTNFPAANTTYQVAVVITMSDGSSIEPVWQLQTSNVI